MYEVTERRMIVPNLHAFTVRAPAVARSVKPGQFVIVRPEDHGERIPLSVADWDREAGTVTSIFMQVGASTAKLARLQPGQTIPTFAGPLGKSTVIDRFGTGVSAFLYRADSKSFPTGFELAQVEPVKRIPTVKLPDGCHWEAGDYGVRLAKKHGPGNGTGFQYVAKDREGRDRHAALVAAYDELNGAEDDEQGDDEGSGGLPAELQRREARREKIRAARERLEAEKTEQLEDRHQKSFADLDANVMKTGEGAMQYCYNAQTAVSEDGIIVATGLSTSPSDAPELLPMVGAAKANTGKRVDTVLAAGSTISPRTSSGCSSSCTRSS